MEKGIVTSDCKERVALDLMQIIADEDGPSKDIRGGGDSAHYYLSLYQACHLAVRGAGTDHIDLTGALKRRLQKSPAS
jgi:hypothetical protein